LRLKRFRSSVRKSEPPSGTPHPDDADLENDTLIYANARAEESPIKQNGGGATEERSALEKIEEIDVGRSEWQRRMRTSLSLHPPRGSSKPGSRTD
jgi:hypothetical protein